MTQPEALGYAVSLEARGFVAEASELRRLHEENEQLRQALAQAEQKKEQEPEWIDDGFGTMWKKCGKKDCGKFVVKIGKVDCWNGDCPEAKEKT